MARQTHRVKLCQREMCKAWRTQVRALDYGDGTVIVTVVCEEQEYTAGVSDTAAVVNAVLTPAQLKSVAAGENIEIRVEVKDISGNVPRKDKSVIENGIKEYRKEIPDLTLGMYVRYLSVR